ncbi:MAG TPA: DUF3887 domain-containing protein [Bryobacteraceae bacterium]|nr:DUF3887 domain-containing protein [Bryobacteraceae bacterium]
MRTAAMCVILFCGAALAAQPDFSRHQACADRLVKAINAGDYEAIEAEFNAQMRDALPIEKTRQFFQGLTAQAGKIRELGKPHWEPGDLAVFPAIFERATLDMKLALDEQGKIAGLLFVPAAP